MTIHLDHTIVPARNKVASAKLLAHLLADQYGIRRQYGLLERTRGTSVGNAHGELCASTGGPTFVTPFATPAAAQAFESYPPTLRRKLLVLLCIAASPAYHRVKPKNKDRRRI
jgi:hypothetical protein